MLILFELGAQVVGTDGRDILVDPDANVLFAVAEGGDSAGPGGGHLVKYIGSALEKSDIGLTDLNR